MKSKVQFQLSNESGVINPAVRIEVCPSEDVRDTVAYMFKEGFGHNHNLLTWRSPMPNRTELSGDIIYSYDLIPFNPLCKLLTLDVTPLLSEKKPNEPSEIDFRKDLNELLNKYNLLIVQDYPPRA